MKKFSIILAAVLFFGCCLLAAVYLDIMTFAGKPSGEGASEKVVAVRPGQGFKLLARDLQKNGLVRHPAKLELLARFRGLDKSIKAGEYVLSPAMTPQKVLEILVAGKVILHKFTVPEGYTLRQIAALAAESGYGTESDFLSAAFDANRALKMGVEAPSLEGYLFPDTYYFPKNTPPEKVIETMVKRFWTVFGPEWKTRAASMGLSVHEAVTLASIIQKEGGTVAEFPIISSVFHNRLKRKMRLESDPTVIYGIEGYDGNITRKHLSTPTPYNTYTIRGLPPGPIASSGEKALEAALYPAATDFLYFVSKKDKTHQFSTRIEDHLRAVRKYQLRR